MPTTVQSFLANDRFLHETPQAPSPLVTCCRLGLLEPDRDAGEAQSMAFATDETPPQKNVADFRALDRFAQPWH